MNSKPIYQSKTLWLNLVGMAILIVNSQIGHLIPTEYGALALAILNIANRFLTTQPVTVLPAAPPAPPAAPAK
jgi:hypothetical protein